MREFKQGVTEPSAAEAGFARLRTPARSASEPAQGSAIRPRGATYIWRRWTSSPAASYWDYAIVVRAFAATGPRLTGARRLRRGDTRTEQPWRPGDDTSRRSVAGAGQCRAEGLLLHPSHIS